MEFELLPQKVRYITLGVHFGLIGLFVCYYL